tara:strand:- start:1155 stop:1298 length:144 start_codon:yes stop_codon:yes gene_type:complete
MSDMAVGMFEAYMVSLKDSRELWLWLCEHHPLVAGEYQTLKEKKGEW